MELCIPKNRLLNSAHIHKYKFEKLSTWNENTLWEKNVNFTDFDESW